jgi:hypothetical protein
MKRRRNQKSGRVHWIVSVLLGLLFFPGCQTTSNDTTEQRLAMAARIQAEPPGNYFIGRRYFKAEFHFWGYVRQPGQPWSTAQLVVLNENQKLAPDRAQRQFGIDSNFEYKLYGHYSGDKVYELVSNRFLPEFVLQSYELISTQPPPIFPSQIYRRPVDNWIIEQPQ